MSDHLTGQVAAHAQDHTCARVSDRAAATGTGTFPAPTHAQDHTCPRVKGAVS